MLGLIPGEGWTWAGSTVGSCRCRNASLGTSVGGTPGAVGGGLPGCAP